MGRKVLVPCTSGNSIYARHIDLEQGQGTPQVQADLNMESSATSCSATSSVSTAFCFPLYVSSAEANLRNALIATMCTITGSLASCLTLSLQPRFVDVTESFYTSILPISSHTRNRQAIWDEQPSHANSKMRWRRCGTSMYTGLQHLHLFAVVPVFSTWLLLAFLFVYGQWNMLKMLVTQPSYLPVFSAISFDIL